MKRAWFFLLVGILCLVIGLVTGRRMFFNMVYLIGLALLLSLIWAWTGISSVRIARRTRSRRSSVGKLAEESFTVANTGILPKVWLEIRDHSTLPVHRVSQVLNALPPSSIDRRTSSQDIGICGKLLHRRRSSTADS